jgi:TRAP-type mannitol/chloroaromatic compound transport system permease small subunit
LETVEQRVKGLMRLSAALDAVSEWAGRTVAWLVLLMVGLGAYNAVARHLSRVAGMELSSNGLLEAQWYLFSAVFLLGASATLKHDEHVRVDVLFGRLSPKGRAWVDLLGLLLLLLPFCVFAVVYSLPGVLESWSIREQSPDPGGLPRYPLKALLPLAFTLLALQGSSEVIKRAALLTADDAGTSHPDGARPEGHDVG